MTPKALLDHAAALAHAVLRLEQPADAVVQAYVRQQRALGPRDRQALAGTVYELLRRLPLYRHLARHGAAAPAPAVLDHRLAALAWRGEPGVPRAALPEAEQAWLAAAGQVDTAALPDALRHNLPDWLAAALQPALGDDFWPLAQALLEPAPLDLRVNTLKAKRTDVQRALEADGHASQPTPYSPWGLRLQGKPSLQTHPVTTQGWVEAQDEGSQLLALLVDAKRNEIVVDFCAGAGGKTLALGAAMRNTGRLYAFDVSGHRLDALKARVERAGLTNVHPAQIAHERDDRALRLSGKADRVLVDAPCTGLGTLRRHPDLKWRQSAGAVVELQARQAAILHAAARLLKPGGRLVYATCSPLEAENEAVADGFTADHAAAWEAVAPAEVLAAARVRAAPEGACDRHFRLWPQRHRTDAFFAAVWRRR